MSKLATGWSYCPSSPPLVVRADRVRRLLFKKRPFPIWSMIGKPEQTSRWIVYFLYSTNGIISPAHHFTLIKLAQENSRLLVVATGLNLSEQNKLTGMADTIVIKQAEGYDFSAYAIAVDLLTKYSPEADVFFLNDSVLGPFVSLHDLIWDASWDFTGLLASAECENHIQSFAFSVKKCSEKRKHDMHPIFSMEYGFNDFGDVIALKETQMARIASSKMSVGAHWYSPESFARNPSMQKPFELIAAGFPFLKKANLEKHSLLHDQSDMRDFLTANDHPLL